MNTGERICAPLAHGQENNTEANGAGWRKWLPAGVAAGALILAGCSTEADQVSENLSTAAEQFEIERRIIFINGITDSVPLVIEGRCSIEVDAADDQLEVTCKTGPDAFKKHFLGLSDNMTYIVEQVEAADADEFRNRIIIKPEQLIPDFDLNTSLGN